MSGPASNYRNWLEKAEHDLLNIENNLAAERVRNRISGLLTQP